MEDGSLQSKGHWESSKVQVVFHLNQVVEFELESEYHWSHSRLSHNYESKKKVEKESMTDVWISQDFCTLACNILNGFHAYTRNGQFLS